MINLRLNEVLTESGHTRYWLWNKTGIRYATLLKMLNGETKRLELSAIDKLCEALACEPCDLIVREKPQRKQKRA